MPTAAALDRLRNTLLGLYDSGQKGFEGLVAMALGRLTGQSFKVAKSGRQVGDAHSTHVAVECKLYRDSNIPQDNLIAKLTRAEAAGADLWVVATTAEIRHPDNEELEGIGDKHGIAVGFLDWPPLAPLPPLAVLLASEPVDVSRFLEQHGSADAAQIAADLAAIAGAAAFDGERDKLAKIFNPAHMGYAQARAACNGWLREQLMADGVSGNGLGQRANVASSDGRLVRRDHVMDRLNNWWANWEPDESRAVLLGLEGMGKTWAALSWWAGNANDMPLTVTIMARHYVGGSAGHAIADAIARQVGEIPEKARDGWLTKVNLWLKGEQADGRPRILLILDGLNENPGTHWSRLLSDLGDSPYRRLVATLITCRPQFWHDHVGPATKRSDTIPTVEVGEYTSEEVKRALELNGLAGKTFSPALMKHLRKPRLFRIAAAHLDIAEGDITVERLIYRDWADRCRSKPGVTPLSEEQFEALVQSLAREAREALPRGVDKVFRDPVVTVEHSKRYSVLSEIVEGGLMMRCLSGYKFPPVHLEHGLGLVLKDDTVRAWEERPDSLDGVIAGYMDPLRALPQEAGILRIAASLALFDINCPKEVRRRLHQEWLKAQNFSDDDWRVVSAHVPSDPALFAYLLEWSWRRPGGSATEKSFLISAFANSLRLPSVRDALLEKCEELSSKVNAGQNSNAHTHNIIITLASLLWEHPDLVPTLVRWATHQTADNSKNSISGSLLAMSWVGRLPRQQCQAGKDALLGAVDSLRETAAPHKLEAARLIERIFLHGDAGDTRRLSPSTSAPDEALDPNVPWHSVPEDDWPGHSQLGWWWRTGNDAVLVAAQRAKPTAFVNMIYDWLETPGSLGHHSEGDFALSCAQVLGGAKNLLHDEFLKPQKSGRTPKFETRLMTVVMLWSSPPEQAALLIRRATKVIWGLELAAACDRQPLDASTEIAHSLASGQAERQLPLLHYLATQRPGIDDVIRSDVVAQLHPTKPILVRIAALKVVEEWGDEALGRMAADAVWRWMPGEAGANQESENSARARCLGRFGGHLPLQRLAERLPPRELAWAVARRGCRVDELEAVAQLTDVLINKVRAGELVNPLDVPADLGVLQAVRSALPSRFANWVEAALGPEGADLADQGSALVYGLCEVLLSVEPPIGLRLWSVLDRFAPPRRSAGRQVQTNALDFLLATAPDRPDVRAQWNRRLDNAKTDAELLDIAMAACHGGKRHWLAEAVEAGLAKDGWRKARSFALAGFDDDRDGKWAKLWEMEADGWVKETRERARAAHLRNFRAWLWFCRFLDHECNAESWVSHRLFFHTVDRRHQLWMKHEIAARGERVAPIRLKCHKINDEALVKAVENWEKEYGARYLGHTVPFGSVWPWLG